MTFLGILFTISFTPGSSIFTTTKPHIGTDFANFSIAFFSPSYPPHFSKCSLSMFVMTVAYGIILGKSLSDSSTSTTAMLLSIFTFSPFFATPPIIASGFFPPFSNVWEIRVVVVVFPCEPMAAIVYLNLSISASSSILLRIIFLFLFASII